MLIDDHRKSRTTNGAVLCYSMTPIQAVDNDDENESVDDAKKDGAASGTTTRQGARPAAEYFRQERKLNADKYNHSSCLTLMHK